MPTRLTYPRTLASALRSADDLTVFVPAAALDRGWTRTLPDEMADLVAPLARDLDPGPLGTLRSTLTRPAPGRRPRQLNLACLPDRGSRHVPVARVEPLRTQAAAAKLHAPGKHVALLVLDEADHALAAVNAIARTLPLYARTSGAARANDVRVVALAPDGAPIALGPTLRRTVDATREAARLVDTPPTDLDPAAFARAAKRALRGLERVTVRELVGPKLLASRLGGIHAVGRTAVAPPRLLVASYRPARAPKSAPHVALVGKGVTYDTGGLSLKVGGSMVTMKGDMGGAAAMLGAFRALTAEKVARRVTLLLAMAENAIGPTSYKPDDVLVMHSRKTVEINNTDAEGRLLLADAASYAARVVGADVVLDAATLTGAQLIATGHHWGAVVANDEGLERTLVEAGRASGDPVHPLPFAPELLQAEFESKIADMKNSVRNRRNAQSSCAAQFIWAHLEGTGVRWGHVDLAGPAFRNERGTGFGVALMAEAVRRL